MLLAWQSNFAYRDFLHAYRIGMPNDEFRHFFNLRYASTAKAMSRLNIDAAMKYLSAFYGKTGRPALMQSQILRAFILMDRIGTTSTTSFVSRLRSDPDLAALAGLSPNQVPSVGSFYDFQYRFWTQPRDEMHLGVNDVLPCDRNSNARDEVFTTYKKDGIGDDGKLPDSNRSITQECENIIRNGRSFPNSYGYNFQELLRILGVSSSREAGLLECVTTISGDGTCFHAHASPNGHHRCDCLERGITNCTCDRRFTDPDATWGYDSDLDEFFYGHTIYTLTSHNAAAHVDLPMHIRVLSARRHDSASGLICLHEFFTACPDSGIKNVCLDSAHDNMPTYRLFNDVWHVNPLIDLNVRRLKKKVIQDNITYDTDGTPVCHAGCRMIYEGKDFKNNRLKFRCPLAAAHKDLDSCPCRSNCSSSSYGRTVYVKNTDDIRLYPPIPRESKLYKTIYKDRTSCERVNNRILNDYHLSTYRGRSAMRVFFFAICAAINIHLDAQLKVVPDSAYDHIEDYTV